MLSRIMTYEYSKENIYSELCGSKWNCSRVLITLLEGQYGGLDREIFLIYVINQPVNGEGDPSQRSQILVSGHFGESGDI